MSLPGNRPAEVLLVEDNDNDVFITRKGFEEANLPVNLHHVENGRECMAYLRKEGKYADEPTPDLILLDLNMPVMDGREVLTEVVQDGQLCQLPVVILTTSNSKQDVIDMYKLRCNSYIFKPVDFNQFQRLIQQLTDYWFTLVVQPPKDEGT